MSDDKSSKKSTDMARRIWLAGIGAYGRAFEEGRDMMRGLSGDISDKTTNAFEALAEKGEEIEMAAKMKGVQLAGKASSLSGDVQSTLAIDDRIQAMRDSGLEITDEIAERAGVAIGSGIGGLQSIEDCYEIIKEKGPRRISPFFVKVSYLKNKAFS